MTIIIAHARERTQDNVHGIDKGLITKTMALQAVQVLSSLIRFFAGP